MTDTVSDMTNDDLAALDFVILGAQKSASTALHRLLRQHPDTYLPRHETPSFEDPVYLADGLRRVTRVVASAASWQRVGIRRPDLLGRPEVPVRLRVHAPHALLIVILRDPVRRAISAYYWYMAHGLLPLAPIDEGMRTLLKGHTLADYPRSGEVLGYGLYAKHLDSYRALFPREQLLVLAAGTLEQMARHAEVFLGVSQISELRKPTRANEGTYNFGRIRLIRAAQRLPTRRSRRAAVALAKRIGFVLRKGREGTPGALPETLNLLYKYYAADRARLVRLSSGEHVTWVGEPAWLS